MLCFPAGGRERPWPQPVPPGAPPTQCATPSMSTALAGQAQVWPRGAPAPQAGGDQGASCSLNLPPAHRVEAEGRSATQENPLLEPFSLSGSPS